MQGARGFLDQNTDCILFSSAGSAIQVLIVGKWSFWVVYSWQGYQLIPFPVSDSPDVVRETSVWRGKACLLLLARVWESQVQWPSSAVWRNTGCPAVICIFSPVVIKQQSSSCLLSEFCAFSCNLSREQTCTQRGKCRKNMTLYHLAWIYIIRKSHNLFFSMLLILYNN